MISKMLVSKAEGRPVLRSGSRSRSFCCDRTHPQCRSGFRCSAFSCFDELVEVVLVVSSRTRNRTYRRRTHRSLQLYTLPRAVIYFKLQRLFGRLTEEKVAKASLWNAAPRTRTQCAFRPATPPPRLPARAPSRAPRRWPATRWFAPRGTKRPRSSLRHLAVNWRRPKPPTPWQVRRRRPHRQAAGGAEHEQAGQEGQPHRERGPRAVPGRARHHHQPAGATPLSAPHPPAPLCAVVSTRRATSRAVAGAP